MKRTDLFSFIYNSLSARSAELHIAANSQRIYALLQEDEAVRFGEMEYRKANRAKNNNKKKFDKSQNRQTRDKKTLLRRKKSTKKQL